jgi:hypothetical protein
MAEQIPGSPAAMAMSYHMYGTRAYWDKAVASSFFNGIPSGAQVGIEGLSFLVKGLPEPWLTEGLGQIGQQIAKAGKAYEPTHPAGIAPALKSGYLATQALEAQIRTSQLPARTTRPIFSLNWT